LPVTKRFTETQHVSLFLTGKMMPENWKVVAADSDFYYLKAHLTNILKRMRVNMGRVEVKPTESKYFAEGLTR
jgi:phenylalanyl-tRNA synthetase beta chain